MKVMTTLSAGVVYLRRTFISSIRPYTLALSLLAGLFFFTGLPGLMGQVPQGISYQAVVRDLNNGLIAEQEVNIRITIKKSGSSDIEYKEEHLNIMTDAAGVVSLQIGDGDALQNNFSDVDWSEGNFEIEQKVDTDADDGTDSYTLTNTTQLLSVPYAFQADQADQAKVADEVTNLPDDLVAGLGLVPIGTVLPYAGDEQSIPTEWMLCDGAELSISEYSKLHNAIGTAYGGNGGTFNIPDMQGRNPLGASGVYPRGNTGGKTEHTLAVQEMPSHSHDIDDPGHVHSYEDEFRKTEAADDADDDDVASNDPPNSFTKQTDPATTNITILEKGGNQPHPILDPYLSLHFIIKVK